MKLLSKNVLLQLTVQEAISILKKAAHYHPKARFTSSNFSMHCVKRTTRGGFILIPVKGFFISTTNGVDVKIEIHAGLGIYIGTAVMAFGLLDLLLCTITHSSRWGPCLGLIVIGAIAFTCAFWDSVTCLEHLEHLLHTKHK